MSGLNIVLLWTLGRREVLPVSQAVGGQLLFVRAESFTFEGSAVDEVHLLCPMSSYMYMRVSGVYDDDWLSLYAVVYAAVQTLQLSDGQEEELETDPFAARLLDFEVALFHIGVMIASALDIFVNSLEQQNFFLC